MATVHLQFIIMPIEKEHRVTRVRISPVRKGDCNHDAFSAGNAIFEVNILVVFTYYYKRISENVLSRMFSFFTIFR